jgi:hypothetical protein
LREGSLIELNVNAFVLHHTRVTALRLKQEQAVKNTDAPASCRRRRG